MSVVVVPAGESEVADGGEDASGSPRSGSVLEVGHREVRVCDQQTHQHDAHTGAPGRGRSRRAGHLCMVGRVEWSKAQ